MSRFWEFHMFLCSFYLLTWLISMAGRELHVVLLPLDFSLICFNRFQVPTGNFHYKQILKNSKLIHILLSHPWFKIFGFACFPKRKLRRNFAITLTQPNSSQLLTLKAVKREMNVNFLWIGSLNDFFVMELTL